MSGMVPNLPPLTGHMGNCRTLYRIPSVAQHLTRLEQRVAASITERSWCTLTGSYCSQMVVASLFREMFEISEHLAALYSPACAQTQKSTRVQRMLLMSCVCLSFLAHYSTRTSSPPRLRYSSVLIIAFYHGVQQESSHKSLFCSTEPCCSSRAGA